MKFTIAPRLETDRLILRGYEVDDFAAMAAYWAEPSMTRYTTGKIPSREEIWSRMMRYAGMWAKLGYGFWLICEKPTNTMVGSAGFTNMHRDIEPCQDNWMEQGWSIHPAMEGKGYATEASQAILSWGQKHYADVRKFCTIHPDNIASIKVALKCGYREELRLMYADKPLVQFRLGENGA
ncbi:N-acetyltransferase [Methylovirgula sp. 4M-Z18]|nr:N-acetyltransferase [Methylovirgula sp. 4M-Z18]